MPLPRYPTVLFALIPALLLAQEPSATLVIPKKKLPAVGLLPDGSQLKGVVLPRYDEHRNLVGVLKAEAMTLVNDEQIAGKKVVIEFFNPDHSSRGRAELENATLYQMKSLLEAKEPIIIGADRVVTCGTGLVYNFEKGEGFISGPVTTIIHHLPAKP